VTLRGASSISRRGDRESGDVDRGCLRQILADLQEARVPCALVGGLAVSARSEPRFTRDADLAVAVANDAEAEALVHLLSGAGYAVDALVEQEATGRLATARLLRAVSARVPVIDLLFASSGIEPESYALRNLNLPRAATDCQSIVV
jgi:hypothetical protein